MTDPTPPAPPYTDTDEELAMANAYIADLTTKLTAAEAVIEDLETSRDEDEAALARLEVLLATADRTIETLGLHAAYRAKETEA